MTGSGMVQNLTENTWISFVSKLINLSGRKYSGTPEFYLGKVTNKAHPEKRHSAVSDLPTVHGGCTVASLTNESMLKRATIG